MHEDVDDRSISDISGDGDGGGSGSGAGGRDPRWIRTILAVVSR